jgi:hypothetical protein
MLNKVAGPLHFAPASTSTAIYRTVYIERYISNVISQRDVSRDSILMWQALLARPVTGGGPGLIPPPTEHRLSLEHADFPRAVNYMPRSVFVWMLVGGPRFAYQWWRPRPSQSPVALDRTEKEPGRGRSLESGYGGPEAQLPTGQSCCAGGSSLSWVYSWIGWLAHPVFSKPSQSDGLGSPGARLLRPFL